MMHDSTPANWLAEVARAVAATCRGALDGSIELSKPYLLSLEAWGVWLVEWSAACPLWIVTVLRELHHHFQAWATHTMVLSMNAWHGLAHSRAQFLSIAEHCMQAIQAVEGEMQRLQCSLANSGPPQQKWRWLRRPENCALMQLNRRSVAVIFCFGAAFGYVTARFIEPQLRHLANIVAGCARLRAYEMHVLLSRWSSRLRWLRPAAEPAQKASPDPRSSRSNSLKGVDIVINNTPADADQIRTSLDDGDLICLYFDGKSYEMVPKPTLVTKPKVTSKTLRAHPSRFASQGRLIDECSQALAHLGPASDRAATTKALEAFVLSHQRPRYALALRHLNKDRRSCVAVLRVVRLPSEATEPPRIGDIVIVYVPSENDPTRSIHERKATTPLVVNRIFDALANNGVLAPYTIRVEANHALDKPGESLHYDSVYRRLFQLSRVA